MGNRSIMIVCLLTAFYLGTAIAVEKSHNMWLTRLDTPTVNDSWISPYNLETKKFNKFYKTLTINFTSLQNLETEDIMCEVKIFQKSGSKYLKAPIDFPKKSCCEFFIKYKTIWECIQQRSSLPETCPVKKGEYWLKDINPDLCNPADNFPPNLPEDYKGVVTMTKGYDTIFKITGYGKLKKKMVLG